MENLPVIFNNAYTYTHTTFLGSLKIDSKECNLTSVICFSLTKENQT